MHPGRNRCNCGVTCQPCSGRKHAQEKNNGKAQEEVNDEGKGKEVEPKLTREFFVSPTHQQRPQISKNEDPLKSCKFLDVYAERVLTDSSLIPIPIDKRLFGSAYDEHIGTDELRQVTRHSELGASVMYLFKQCVAENLLERFAFLSPYRTTHLVRNQSHHIADAINAHAHPDQLHLAPTNTGGH